MLFDESYYLSINEARWQVAESILNEIKSHTQLSLNTCIDVGCGPGWFAERLVNWGLKLQGIDGRKELVELAKQRVPLAQFYQIDVESKTEISSLSPADLVFCFGLIYHTENPFRVIRNLFTLTQKILLIESITVLNDEPITWLVEEGKNETQGLTHYAMIPSKNCLLKMLQVAGMQCIYEYTETINHPDFQDTPTKYKRRHLFMASKLPISLSNFQAIPEIETPKYRKSKFDKIQPQ